MSDNLLLRNNFGKTILQLGIQMNPRSQNNNEFLRAEIMKQIEMKVKGTAFIIDKIMKRNDLKMNKYIVRDIYKYIDG
jgi:hypothetical protein